MDQNVYVGDNAGNDSAAFGDDFPNKEWIIAGICVMREQGPRQLSVTTICQEIDKQESEFNNLFNGLESYLFSLLDYWYEKETIAYIEQLDEMGGNARENLLAMVEILHHVDKRDEIAIRNWALRCPNAHKALAKVDRTRMDVGIGLFKELGFSDKDSILRAKIFYTSSIGTEYTSVSSSLDQKFAMCELLMRHD